MSHRSLLRQRSGQIVTGISVIVVKFASVAAAQSTAPPDVRTLFERGVATAVRLQSETVAWTTTIELPKSDITVQTSTTQSKNARDFAASFVRGGQSHPLIRIIESDGVWYVFEDGVVSKCRPYEAPLSLPAIYLFLAKSELRFVVEDALLQAKVESQKKNIITYRIPLEETIRRQLQQSLAGFNQLKQQNPSRPDARAERMIPQMREVLERGTTIDVDADTGVVLAYGVIGKRIWVKDIHWKPNQKAVDLPAETAHAIDLTGPLVDSAASLEDLVMFSHASAWQPGGPELDTDVVIVDSVSGAIRRIPYPMGNAIPGCFAKDRRSVFISGHIPDEGRIGLFQINLATGSVRRLAEKELPGFTLFPTLSPDGRTLAVINKSGQESALLNSQVCLVEISTGRVRKIGTPMDTAFLNWLPDQSGLILVTRKYRDLDLPAETTIVRMNFKGEITPITKGAFPIVLAQQKRILFLDESDDLFKTCDFSGKNVTLLGDGLKGFGFPSLSPDGQRLILMRFDKSTGPRPFFVDLTSGAVTPVEVRGGLWASPAWR